MNSHTSSVHPSQWYGVLRFLLGGGGDQSLQAAHAHFTHMATDCVTSRLQIAALNFVLSTCVKPRTVGVQRIVRLEFLEAGLSYDRRSDGPLSPGLSSGSL